MTVTLHQFEFSHFNEKARWALAYKALAHQRKSYLPGPHMPQIKKISGQTQTPVLQIDETFVAGSAAIIDVLESRYPEHPLYPSDAGHRAEALSLQQRFDHELGPAVRTVLFASLIHHGSYLTNMFGRSKSPVKRAAYRMTYPLARPLIAKGNGVSDPENVVRCRGVVDAFLAELGQKTTSGYLVADDFSVADLTAASLLAPIAAVDHVDMARPTPVPEDMAALYETYASHPVIAWVKSIYENHRPG